MEVTEFSVRYESDVGHVRRCAQRVAEDLGFDSQAVSEIGTALTELATNLVRHQAVDGRIVLQRIDGEDGSGMECIVQDFGPGIVNPEAALRDHETTLAQSMGCGLGVVRRLMDEFDLHSCVASDVTRSLPSPKGPTGTLITTRKYLRATGEIGRLAYSVATRPHPLETANGDDSLVLFRGNDLLVAVADGLGHGEDAAHASGQAIAYVREHADEDLSRIFEGLHERLRKTRGAALSLIRIDTKEQVLFHAGIGNIETRVYPNTPPGVVGKPGVVGTNPPPQPRVRKVPWPTGGMLIAFTDGIHRRWSLEEMPDLRKRPVTMVGQLLLRAYGKDYDDATVVVVREGPR